jgi:hypothetical protein
MEEKPNEIERQVGSEVVQLLSRIAEMYAHELSVREEQTAVRKLQIEKADTYAHTLLDAEFKEHDKERAHELMMAEKQWNQELIVLRRNQMFILLMVLIALASVFIGMWLNKEATIEVIKILSYLAIAVLAYFAGRRKAPNNNGA